MKQNARKLASWLLTLAMCLSMVPAFSLSALADAAVLNGGSTTWSVDSTIESNVEITGNVSVHSSMTLTIPEGKTLTVNGRINTGNNTLTVAGAGELIVNGANGANGGSGGIGVSGNLTVESGTVTVTGGKGADDGGDGAGWGGIGVYGNLTVNGGTVDVTGGYSGKGRFGNGGNGVVGNLTVSGGTVTVYGGKGSDGSVPGDGGIGVTNNVTVNGGTVTVTGGSGGEGSSGNGSNEKAVGGTITCGDSMTAEESNDGGTWNAVSNGSSGKQYVRFTPAPVASVGTTGYTTFADALAAWSDGTTLKLLADAETASTINVTGTKTLDLNGFGIKRTGSTNYSVITVSGGASLTLNDSTSTRATSSGNRPTGVVGGYITGGNKNFGGGVYNSGTFTMNGGTITGNTASAWGGGVNNGGTFTMNGGTISGNTASSNGGGVYNSNSFTMNGGTISGNTATVMGGGVYNSGTFTMTDGTITGNTAEQGGGVYNNDSTITMTGGTVSGNTATNGGGVYSHDGTFSLSGAPSITGNKNTSDAANNVETTKALNVTAALTDGASVGVSTVGMAFAQGSNYALVDTDAAKFTADENGYNVKLENNQLVLAEPVTGPDLTLVLTADSGTVTPGGTFSVTVALRNNTGAAMTVSALDVTFPTSDDYTLGAFTKDGGVAGTAAKNDSKSALTFYAGSAANNLTIPANDTVTLGTLSVTAANLSNRESITVAVNTTGTYHLYQTDAGLPLGAENAVKGLAYTVTFDSNGGSDVEAQTVAYNGTVTAPTTPTKNGYRFKAWQLSGADYVFAAHVTQNITLVALWQEQKTVSLGTVPNAEVTLTYLDENNNPQTVNEGEIADIDADTPVTVNITIDTSAPEKKDAYEITVMYGDTEINPTNNTYTFTPTDEHPITVTLTPIDYTIIYDTDGGEEIDSPNYNVESLDTLPTPTKTGYTFTGWKVTAAEGNWTEDDTLNSGASLNGKYGDVILQAQWTMNEYTVTYELNGGTVATANPETYTVESPDFTLTNPTKNGYTFAGWTGTGLNAPTQSVTVAQGSTENRTYTATWTPINYTVTYELDGGTMAAANPTSYNIESTANLPTPTRTGFNFTGWKVTAADGSWAENEIVGGGTPLANQYGNVTLTAQWSLNAKIVFADYAYAGTGYKLLLVGANPGEGKMLTYEGQSMFQTTTENYVTLVNTNDTSYTSVYVYIVEAGETEESVPAKLGVADGANTAVNRSGDLDENNRFNSNDWGIVNDMLADANYSASLSIQRRLSADVDSTDAGNSFGSIKDIDAILNYYYDRINN